MADDGGLPISHPHHTFGIDIHRVVELHCGLLCCVYTCAVDGFATVSYDHTTIGVEELLCVVGDNLEGHFNLLVKPSSP